MNTQNRKTIDAIVVFISEDIAEDDVILPPNTIAKLIWSQFTGIVLVNATLNSLDQGRKETLHEELKWMVSAFFNGLLTKTPMMERVNFN